MKNEENWIQTKRESNKKEEEEKQNRFRFIQNE
jgi:hypothetical protein